MLDLETFKLRAKDLYPKTSLQRKEVVLRQYDSFLENNGLQPGLESLNLWLDDLLKRGLSRSTLNVYTYDVLSYFELMMFDLDEKKLKLLKKRLPPQNVGEVDFLTDEEVAKLITNTPSPINKLIYSFCFAYARRLGEVLALTWKDIDLENNKVTFTILKKKREEKATYELESWIKEMIIKYKDVLGKEKLFERTERAVEIAFKKDCERAGIQPQGRKLRPHILRHCLHPNTRILIPEGILPAKLLYFRHSPVNSIDLSTLEVREDEVVRKSFHIADRLVSLWAGGRELVCTPEHRVFRLRNGNIEEVEVRDLRIGDYIAGISKVAVSATKKVLDDKIWRVLGYYVGDGSIESNGNAVVFHEKDEKIMLYYKRLLAELGFKPIVHREKGRNSFRLAVYSVALAELVRSLGLSVPSKERRVPLELFHASDGEVAEFISGFYDAEGVNSPRGSFPRMFSVSKDLLKDVQLLLLRFGITSQLEPRWRKVKLPQGREFKGIIYTLCISSSVEGEKFRSTFKTIKELKIKPGRKGIYRYDVIPVGDVIRRIYERRKKLGKKLAIGKLSLSKYLRAHPSRETLEKLLEILKDEPEYEFLKKLCSSVVMWLKVKKIEWSKAGHGKVLKGFTRFLTYDFEVDKYQTLITDGIISHNSRLTSLRNRGIPLDLVSKYVARHSRFDTTVQFYRGITEEEKISIPKAEEIFGGGG